MAKMRPDPEIITPAAATTDSEMAATLAEMKSAHRELVSRMESATPGVDFEAIKQPVITQIRDSLLSVIQESSEDIKQYVDPILEDLSYTMSVGDEAGASICKAQLRALAEAGRITVENEHWKVIDAVIDTALSVATAFLSALIIRMAEGA